MIRRGLALLSGGPAFAAALSAQTVPAPQFFSAQLSASCFVAVVPTHECFRQADLLVHDQRLNAKARDYRYEGLAIGAAAGGVGGLLLSGPSAGSRTRSGRAAPAR